MKSPFHDYHLQPNLSRRRDCRNCYNPEAGNDPDREGSNRNMLGGGKGLFVDVAGTYRVSGQNLAASLLVGKGTTSEYKAEVVYRVSQIDNTTLRMIVR